MHKRIFTVLLAFVLIFAFVVNTSANELPAEVPDLSLKGSLKFNMDVEGVPLNSGSLNMYYVASLVCVGGPNYDFKLVDELEEAGAQLDSENLYDGDQAENLLEVAIHELDKYHTASIKEGVAYFEDLDAGLYLVWQDEKDASDGYAAIRPFLISVPRLMNDVYEMHVVAKPKVPFEPKPSEPPPPPPPPNLPPTGQLNWPVPVMAVSGVLLVALGWCLRLKGKRSENEE